MTFTRELHGWGRWPRRDCVTARPRSPEEAAALARTTVNLFRAWELTDAEARTLLGDMAQRTWARWKTGDIGRIDRDLRARMAILMGITKRSAISSPILPGAMPGSASRTPPSRDGARSTSCSGARSPT